MTHRPRSNNPFAGFVTEALLKRLAGDRSYARGAAYFRDGAVQNLVQSRDALAARVLGSEEYRVALRPAGRTLSYSCTCPVGEDGEFCKHCVATGLAWLDRCKAGEPAGDDLDPARAYLAAQSKQALIELLLEQAAGDPELHARLQGAALKHAPPTDLKALKDAVRRALATPGGFVDYRGMRALVVRADSVAELLRKLLDSGRAAQAVDVADYAVRRGIAAYERSDDSSGALGGTLHAIAALHLEACRAARTDGEALGAALFDLQLLDDWGFFEFEAYAPLLGQQGLARYRALAEKAWRNVPALEPGDRREHEGKRFLVTRIVEKLAERDGDVDALIAVKSRDLSHSHAFLEIAQLLAKAGRHEEALAWAERACKAFPQEYNRPLVEFLVGAYRRAKRMEDATALAWQHFADHPGLAAYQLLRTASGAGGWSTWRDKALAQVRAGMNGKRSPWIGGGRSLLVEIFLDEGDSGAALAEARAGGCSEGLWMQIADAREAGHPQDAIAIYQARIDPIVAHTDKRAYDEAAELAGKIGELMKRSGREKEFGEWVESVRAKHKAKRNFMKRLEGVG